MRTIIVVTNLRTFVFQNQTDGQMFAREADVRLRLEDTEHITEIISVPDMSA